MTQQTSSPEHQPRDKEAPLSKKELAAMGAVTLVLAGGIGYAVFRQYEPPEQAGVVVVPPQSPTPEKQGGQSAITREQAISSIKSLVKSLASRSEAIGDSDAIEKYASEPNFVTETIGVSVPEAPTSTGENYSLVISGKPNATGDHVDVADVEELTIMQNDGNGSQTASYLFSFDKGDWIVREAHGITHSVSQYTTNPAEVGGNVTITNRALLTHIETDSSDLLAAAEALAATPLTTPTPSSSPVSA